MHRLGHKRKRIEKAEKEKCNKKESAMKVHTDSPTAR